MSLSNVDFIVPEEPLEQEHFKRQLITTARSLKKKQQQLEADQDLLNDRWTDVLAAEEYGLRRLIRLQRIYNFLLFHAIILSVLDV